jgi:hypothetical protein
MIQPWRLTAGIFGDSAVQSGLPLRDGRNDLEVVAYCRTGLLFPDNEAGMMRGAGQEPECRERRDAQDRPRIFE